MKNGVLCLLVFVAASFWSSGCSDSSAPQAVSVLEIDIEITDSMGKPIGEDNLNLKNRTWQVYLAYQFK